MLESRLLTCLQRLRVCAFCRWSLEPTPSPGHGCCGEHSIEKNIRLSRVSGVSWCAAGSERFSQNMDQSGLAGCLAVRPADSEWVAEEGWTELIRCPTRVFTLLSPLILRRWERKPLRTTTMINCEGISETDIRRRIRFSLIIWFHWKDFWTSRLFLGFRLECPRPKSVWKVESFWGTSSEDMALDQTLSAVKRLWTFLR